MGFPKQLKDIIYQLLQEPTLDNLREFLKNQTGEHNAIDFKRTWIEKGKLAKLILSLANYGGGIVIFGVEEKEDHTFDCTGLNEIKEKEHIAAGIKDYISSNLKYDIYNFQYQSSEYEALTGKSFQMLVVEDTPEFLPFISRKEGDGIKASVIYIRRGVSDEQVTEEELTRLLDRRMKFLHPVTGRPLDLETHLQQLNVLYKNISPTIRVLQESKSDSVLPDAPFEKIIYMFDQLMGRNYKEERNPLYPDESYEEFISKLIGIKKDKIRRVLDLY